MSANTDVVVTSINELTDTSAVLNMPVTVTLEMSEDFIAASGPTNFFLKLQQLLFSK